MLEDDSLKFFAMPCPGNFFPNVKLLQNRKNIKRKEKSISTTHKVLQYSKISLPFEI